MSGRSKRAPAPSQKALEAAEDHQQSRGAARTKDRVGFAGFGDRHASIVQARGGDEPLDADEDGEVTEVAAPTTSRPAKRIRKSKKWNTHFDLVLAKAGLQHQVWKVAGSKLTVQQKWGDTWDSLQEEPHRRIFSTKTKSATRAGYDKLVDDQSKRNGEAQRNSGAGTEDSGSEDEAEKQMKAELVRPQKNEPIHTF